MKLVLASLALSMLTVTLADVTGRDGRSIAPSDVPAATRTRLVNGLASYSAATRSQVAKGLKCEAGTHTAGGAAGVSYVSCSYNGWICGANSLGSVACGPCGGDSGQQCAGE